MRRGKEIDFLVLMRAKARAAVLASYPTDTVSGAAASFPDGADGVPVVDLKVSIKPVQSGSGDPSPENVRPISGWTGANVTRVGKNLCSNFGTLHLSVGNTVGTFGSFSDLSNADLYYIETKRFDKLTVSFDSSKVNSSIARITYSDSIPAVNVREYRDFNCSSGSTVTINKNYKYIAFIFQWNNSDDKSLIQIENGSSATSYEPYSGDTYSISFPSEAGTVYGGELDVTTGVLTVTHGQIASYAGETLPGEWISDRDVYAEGTSPSTGAQVVYELAEPVTYQLAPIQVKTLLGENNIWADTGDVELEYRADLEKYIEKKIGEADTGTLSLGNAPAVVRPGTGLEMQPLGLDDAGVDYLDDMEDDAESYPDDLEDEYEEPEDAVEEEEPEEPTEDPEPEEDSDDDAAE